MNFYRKLTFKELVSKVVKNIPEADPALIRRFLRINSKPPYDSRHVAFWTRQIEKLMYL